ncbi:efflux RND transporter periplasmic adaptor subunit [Planosporangium sp. 12N6]|uniref:efflux RND transporter periplasmic adaptor subunit n=1 Tax=Planosporangium spinosum TaxID=3402278 RepID=UPI003CF218B8
MSFLRRLPLILRRIPPLLRRLVLLWRYLAMRVPTTRRMSRSARTVNAALATLLLAGALVSYRTVSVADTSTTGSGVIRAGLVTRGTVISTVSTAGTVQSGSMANVSFAGPGTVTEIDVKVGDAVKKDQVLAKINAAPAQEQLSAAQATLASAQQSLAQVKASTRDPATIAFAEAQVTTARNNVNAAQRAVTGATLTAPTDGTVIAINGTVGSLSTALTPVSGGATPGDTPFIQLADLTKLQISAAFPEADAIRLKTGLPATVTWVALSGSRAEGKVTAIAPAATTQNNVNSYTVVVTLDRVPDGARIGQTVNVTVAAARVDDVVRAPVSGVRDSGQQQTVEVIRADGRRETRTVTVGLRGDDFVEIQSGLAPGEQVTLGRGSRGAG